MTTTFLFRLSTLFSILKRTPPVISIADSSCSIFSNRPTVPINLVCSTFPSYTTSMSYHLLIMFIIVFTSMLLNMKYPFLQAITSSISMSTISIANLPSCTIPCLPGESNRDTEPLINDTCPSNRLVVTAGASRYALTLNLVPKTLVSVCLALTTNCLPLCLDTSKYASPSSSTSVLCDVLCTGYVNEVSAFNHTFVPSDRFS